MDEQLLQNLKSTIEKSEKIVVLVGKNPTVDQMAAALSLSLVLRSLQKSPQVITGSEPTVAVGSLVGIDQVHTQPASNEGDLIVSFPYKDGEIENVSYTMDDNFLNIVVKAGEIGLSFDEQSVKFTRGTGVIQLLLTIGVSYNDDMYTSIAADSLTDATIVNIDNNDSNERYGDINLVSGRFSSLSEQVADLILTLGYETSIDQDAAQNLLSGIIDGTNNFQNDNTSFLAFEMAAELMKKGATREQARALHTEARDDFMSLMQQPKQQNQPAQSKLQQQNQIGQNTQRNQQPKQQNQNRQQQQPRSQSNQNTQGGQPTQPKPQRDPFADLAFSVPAVSDVVEEQVVQQESRPQSDKGQNTPPADWLTPKVYKGSSNV